MTKLIALPDGDTYLSRSDLARILLVARSTLANWASAECGPPFTKLGKRRVVYRAGDVREWLSELERGGGS